MLSGLPKFNDVNLLVGVETSDDAAVYKITDDIAMIQTLDFFTPVVDDPYTFGQIAAANALSDVYAMGGEPKVALNIAAFPNCLDPSILGEILKGGASKVKEAGAVLAGGHTIEDEEPKYGLSVTGFVHPDKVRKNTGALPGDVLILTKSVGSGVLITAVKGGFATREEYHACVDGMKTLNKYAAQAMSQTKVRCCTDITGFGLIGHSLEMAQSSEVTIELEADRLPLLPGAKDYAAMGLIPAGAYRNKEYAGDKVRVEPEVEEVYCDLAFDPQTSGGLLICVPKEEAENLLGELEKQLKPGTFAQVGSVVPKQECSVILKK